MNSELLTKLLTIVKENKKRIEELKEEYVELTDIEREQTKEDLKRIKAIRKELASLKSMSELDADLKELNFIRNKIKNYEKILKNDTSDDKLKKQLLQDKIKELKNDFELFGNGLADKYSDLITEYDKSHEVEKKEQEEVEEKPEVVDAEIVEEVEEENKKKPSKINKTALTLAILAMLGIGTTAYAISKGNKNNGKNTETTSMSETKEDTKNITATTNNEVVISKEEINKRIEEERKEEENLKFTDINDEEQVNERAYEVIQYLDENLGTHDYTVDEVANIIRWINGGNVESVTYEDALYAISRVEDICNKENQEEVKNTFDVSQLYLDGSRGQKLAGKIYESKKALKETKGTEAFQKEADKFAELIVNSWLLNGTNNVESAYSLEKAGMKTFVDVYFMNTYAYIDVPVDITITVVDREKSFNLAEVADILNNQPYCDEEGNYDENAMDKFSSDLKDMVVSAEQVKANSKTLTK